MIEKNNPITQQKTRDVKKQAPDDHTYEVTNLDFSPIGQDCKHAAKILAKARTRYENDVSEDDYLHFSSRLLRSGDWIVWAEDQYTRDWLGISLLQRDFSLKYRATLLSVRGALVRYTVKVSWPDSEDPNEPIIDHLFSNLGNLGYIRLSDEIRWYADPTIQKSYTQSKKNKKKYSPPADAMYDKMFWLKVSPAVHRIVQDNLNRLRTGYGVGTLKVELAKGQDSSAASKRSRPTDGDDQEGERPSRHARHDGPVDTVNLASPEIPRDLNRSLSQLSLDQVEDTDDQAGPTGHNPSDIEPDNAGDGNDNRNIGQNTFAKDPNSDKGGLNNVQSAPTESEFESGKE